MTRQTIVDKGWFKSGEKAYYLEKKFKSRNEADAFAKKRRTDGKCAVVKVYSSKKRENPCFVFVTKTNRKIGSGSGKRSRAHFIDNYYKERIELKKLANDYINLKSPISKSKTKVINAKIRSYKNAKSLNAGQRKMLKDLVTFKKAAKKLHVNSRNKMADILKQKKSVRKAKAEFDDYVAKEKEREKEKKIKK